MRLLTAVEKTGDKTLIQCFTIKIRMNKRLLQ
jgi:hypothetical protein